MGGGRWQQRALRGSGGGRRWVLRPSCSREGLYLWKRCGRGCGEPLQAVLNKLPFCCRQVPRSNCSREGLYLWKTAGGDAADGGGGVEQAPLHRRRPTPACPALKLFTGTLVLVENPRDWVAADGGGGVEQAPLHRRRPTPARPALKLFTGTLVLVENPREGVRRAVALAGGTRGRFSGGAPIPEPAALPRAQIAHGNPCTCAKPLPQMRPCGLFWPAVSVTL